MRAAPSLLFAALTLLLVSMASASAADRLFPAGLALALAEDASQSTPSATTPRQDVTAAAEGCQLAGRIVPAPAMKAGNQLLGVHGSDPSNIWAVGRHVDYNPQPWSWRQDSLALRWDGHRWTNVPVEIPVDDEHYLNDVAVLAPDNVWAVGAYGGGGDLWPRILHWDGTQWNFSHRPETPESHAYRDLRGIAAISPDDIWAVGTSQQSGPEYLPIVTHWDGTAWTDMDVPQPNAGRSRLHDVSAVASNDVWAVGYSASSTYILHWDGAYWGLIPAYPGAENDDLYLYGVHAIATDDVWAVGHHMRGDALYPLAMHWDGTNWTQHWLPVSDREGMAVDDVTASGPNDVWVTANYLVHHATFLLHWDGREWTEVPHAEPGTVINKFEAVEVFGPHDAWVVGATGNDSRWEVLIEAVRRFTDVSATDYFAGAAFCLADRGVISGYEGCSFRPGNPVSRAQLTKMVVLSAGWSDPTPVSATFADVPEGSTFYSYVEAAAQHQVIGGYECGRRDGEECDAGRRPYFRPNEGVTRGQAAKIISTAAGFEDDPGRPLFSDVPPGSTFYEWVQRLAKRHVLGGYACGSTPDEACDERSLAYFRPGGQVTRGQAAKIVANSFFPDCPATPTPK